MYGSDHRRERGARAAYVYRLEAANLAAGDFDTVLMGFGEGDLISFAASLSGQVSAVVGSSAGLAPVRHHQRPAGPSRP